jgi:hypothetical protein
MLHHKRFFKIFNYLYLKCHIYHKIVCPSLTMSKMILMTCFELEGVVDQLQLSFIRTMQSL